MKAQITLEYLILSAVALAVLAFSLVALGQIKDRSEKAFNNVLFKSSATQLANTMNEICALGNGNKQAVHLERKMDIEGATDHAKFIDTETKLFMSEKSYCKVSDSSGLYGSVEVENKDGVIEVKKI